MSKIKFGTLSNYLKVLKLLVVNGFIKLKKMFLVILSDIKLDLYIRFILKGNA